MYKKAWCTCKVVVLRNKPIAFLTSWLPSPSSLLKLRIQGSGWPGSPLNWRSGSGTATDTQFNDHNGLRTCNLICNFHCTYLECARLTSDNNYVCWTFPSLGDLSVTGGFRSVALQRRPDKGGLVSHRGVVRRKCTRFRGSGTTCQSVFSSIYMVPLSVSRQFKKYYFIFKAESRLGRYIFKIKVK